MATTTERILQSSSLEAAIALIAPREFGLTADTERPVIGSSVAGAKFLGTEDLVSVVTAAPAAFGVLRRSIVRVFVDTSAAGGNVALDIQAGAQSAGYTCKIFVSGPDTRQAIVTYGIGLIEYIPAGIAQEFIWDGSKWNKSQLSWADRYNIGSYIESDIDETASAKNPIIKLWDADHILDVTNYPLLVPKLRAEKVKSWSGSVFVTDHSVTVAAGVVTGSGTAWTNFLAALAEEVAVHGSYTNWRCGNINGVDYAITNVNTVAGTLTLSGSPATGSQTFICYARRIAGSTTTARTYKDSGRALMSHDGSLRTAGLRRRFHMQGHWHQSGYFSAGSGQNLTVASSNPISGSFLQNVSDQVRDPKADGTNGTPIIGPESEPNSSTIYRTLWAGVLI